MHSALMFDKAKKLPSYGVRIGKEEDITLDFDQVNKRKDEIVTQVNGGVDYLMKKNKVDVIRGVGKILNKSSVEVTDSSGKKRIMGRNLS